MSGTGDTHNQFSGDVSGHVVQARDIGEIHVHGSARAAPGDVEYAAAALADIVAAQWKQEAALRSLDDPDPIPVRWRLRPGLSDHPASIQPPGSTAATTTAPPSDDPTAGDRAEVLAWEASSGDIEELARRFRGLRRRRLVIVGGPGSGKTTLAVQLLLHLLNTRQLGEPVPVLLPIAGWDTTAFPRLHDWLADRLPRDYPALRSAEFGPRVVRALTAGSHILPVLDGLDELPPTAQTQVITAVNRLLSGQDQLILTSRTTEFTHAVRAARDVITSAAVLQARPLPPATAADYLQSCLPPDPGPQRRQPWQQAWQQILDGLRTPPPAPAGEGGRWAALATITATPLGVWLLRTVYTAPTADPAELTDARRFPTPAALRAHLFDALIPALIAARPPSSDPAQPFRPRRHRDPDNTRRWLGYLAHLLTHPRNPDDTPRTRDLAWWHIARHTTTPTTFRTTAGLMVGVTAGLAGALAGVLAGVLTVGLTVGLTGWLASGLGFGLVVWLVVGLIVGLMSEDWAVSEPGFADLHLQRRGTLLIRKLAVWLAVWLAFVLAIWLAGGPTVRLVVGLPFGLTIGLTVGLTKWMESPARAERASTPLTNWRADRTLTLARTITGGLVIGLTMGLVIWLAVGLAVELTIGLVVGLIAGDRHAWLAYLVAVGRLARRGDLPRDLMRFLDDTHRLGLLRAVGPLYQFRHAELQDHLADSHQPPS